MRTKQKRASARQRRSDPRNALLLKAAKALEEIRAGPHGRGELSQGEEWLQEEQEKFERLNPDTPRRRAKFRRAIRALIERQSLTKD